MLPPRIPSPGWPGTLLFRRLYTQSTRCASNWLLP
jgi:hypothetical protein